MNSPRDMTSSAPVALVTGSSSGIGLSTCQLLLSRGYYVAGLDVLPPTEYAEDSTAFVHIECDVTLSTDVYRAIDQIQRRWERLDAVVNNAGVHPPHRSIDQISIEDLRRTLSLNLEGAFIVSKAAISSLRTSRGSLVNVASLVASLGQEQAVDYCISKGGLLSMTRALALDEAHHGVRANCVSPGAIRTVAAERMVGERQLRKAASFQWFDRLGTGDEVASAIAFLCSRDASYITGQDLRVCGGADLGYGVKGAAFFEWWEEEAAEVRGD